MDPGNREKNGHLGRFSEEKASVQRRYLDGSAPLHENGRGKEHNKHNAERTPHDGIASNNPHVTMLCMLFQKIVRAQEIDSNPTQTAK